MCKQAPAEVVERFRRIVGKKWKGTAVAAPAPPVQQPVADDNEPPRGLVQTNLDQHLIRRQNARIRARNYLVKLLFSAGIPFNVIKNRYLWLFCLFNQSTKLFLVEIHWK